MDLNKLEGGNCSLQTPLCSFLTLTPPSRPSLETGKGWAEGPEKAEVGTLSLHVLGGRRLRSHVQGSCINPGAGLWATPSSFVPSMAQQVLPWFQHEPLPLPLPTSLSPLIQTGFSGAWKMVRPSSAISFPDILSRTNFPKWFLGPLPCPFASCSTQNSGLEKDVHVVIPGTCE